MDNRGQIIHEGKCRKIIAARDGRDIPFGKFYDSLEKEEKNKILTLIDIFADQRWMSNREKFRKLKDDIWELKSGQQRILGFFEGQWFVITHGFIKKQDKTPKNQIERAIRIKKQYQAAG